MLKSILSVVVLSIFVTACREESFSLDYDGIGGLESWQANAEGGYSSPEHGNIDAEKLSQTIARNVLHRIQHITFCAQVNDASFAIYNCEAGYEKAFLELQALQTSLNKLFKPHKLSINIDNSAVLLSGLNQTELINILYSEGINFSDAEKALVLYFVLGDWMKEDAWLGISEALAIYHYHKNYYVGDNAICNQGDEMKTLHSWMLGSYLYSNNLPLNVNYNNYPSAEAFFNAMIDKRDNWSFAMDSIISQSILHEDLHFRLPAKILLNTQGEAIVYRLHKNINQKDINLKVGDKVLGFNDFLGATDSAEQQNREMLKALNSDKRFHWHIQRGSNKFIVTTTAQNIAAPIEDSLITDTFKHQGENLHYFKLESFVTGFEANIDAALAALAKQPAASIIIDLRANGGGSNETLLYLLKTLFPEQEQPFNMMVRENGLLNKSPIAVHSAIKPRHYKHHYILLDADSLSASEQFAHAVQHREDVTVLSNSQTHGKRISNHTWQGNCGKSYQLVTSFALNSLGKLLPETGITADIMINAPYKNVFYSSKKDPFIEKVISLNQQRIKTTAKPLIQDSL